MAGLRGREAVAGVDRSPIRERRGTSLSWATRKKRPEEAAKRQPGEKIVCRFAGPRSGRGHGSLADPREAGHLSVLGNQEEKARGAAKRQPGKNALIKAGERGGLLRNFCGIYIKTF